MKCIKLMMLLLFLCSPSFAQVTVEILTAQPEDSWVSEQHNEDPYNTTYEDSRAQALYLAGELTDAGLAMGLITALHIKCYEKPGRSVLKDFRIRMKQTDKTDNTAWVTEDEGWTLVFGPADISPSEGHWNEYTLSTPFEWDGVSNLLIDITRDDTDFEAGGGMYIRTGLENRTVARGEDSEFDWPFDEFREDVFDFVPRLKITANITAAEESRVEIRGGRKGFVNVSEGEEAEIIFNAARAGRVEVKVFDRRGRLVWETSQKTAGGSDSVKWGCENTGGNVVSSGAYFVHVSGPGIDAKSHIAVIR